MILKFGRKVNDLIEQQIKPEFGNPSNPYDLFEGKNFGLHVRKVGEWNNYDLCQFVGDKAALIINGSPVEKTEASKKVITDYLKTGPLDLDKYDYKDWTDEEHEKVMRIIKNTIPDGRIISDIISTASNDSRPSSNSSSSGNDFFQETKSKAPASSKNEADDFLNEAPKTESKPAGKKSNPSLDDLYNDL